MKASSGIAARNPDRPDRAWPARSPEAFRPPAHSTHAAVRRLEGLPLARKKFPSASALLHEQSHNERRGREIKTPSPVDIRERIRQPARPRKEEPFRFPQVARGENPDARPQPRR